jgi:hypothetical protein
VETITIEEEKLNHFWEQYKEGGKSFNLLLNLPQIVCEKEASSLPSPLYKSLGSVRILMARGTFGRQWQCDASISPFPLLTKGGD